jgi:hypothetical protein
VAGGDIKGFFNEVDREKAGMIGVLRGFEFDDGAKVGVNYERWHNSHML